MDHTPAVSADDRAIKLLERTPVDDAHKERLFALVRRAQEAAAADGRELQAEFGKEAVALIVGCNQFLRVFRAGGEPGAVELRVLDDEKERLRAAGFDLRPPEGQVFRLFGWTRLDPMAADPTVLADAVEAAYALARK